MNPDEIGIDLALVRRLVTGQFGQWAALPLTEVNSAGTDNAIYLLSDELAVRLPRRSVRERQTHLGYLAGLLSAEIDDRTGRPLTQLDFGTWGHPFVFAALTEPAVDAADRPLVDLPVVDAERPPRRC